MSVSVDFRLLGVRLVGFDITLDQHTDKVLSPGRVAGQILTNAEVHVLDSAVNKTVKWFSRKWTQRMTK